MEGLRWFWLAGHAAGLLWDFEAWEAIAERFVEHGRASGTRAVLPVALSTRAGAHLFAGDFSKAAALTGEETAISEVTGSGIALYGALGEAAFRGRTGEAQALIAAGTRDAARRGEGVGVSFIQWATALLCNGTGKYRQALAAAREAGRDEPAQRFRNWGLAELVEAASRVGEREEAAEALDRLSAAGGVPSSRHRFSRHAPWLISPWE
ncbi:hypothetical protein ACFYXS_06800 [Streptomyces sp. NPDC002574]|uniref:hypothetical protein n=1 Tax=Streptomyces sp. NPDC002574 TaxID=3364652 RepID=UPI0036B26F90